MKSKPSLAIAVFVVLYCGMSAQPALAQYRNLFMGWGDLTKEDLAHMKQTARERMDGQPAGTILEWRNEESQNWGRVKLVEEFEYQAMPCREVLHAVAFKSGTRKTARFKICKTKEEGWKILE